MKSFQIKGKPDIFNNALKTKMSGCYYCIYRGYSHFEMNMPFISSREAKNAYFMSGEATNEIYFFSLHEMK